MSINSSLKVIRLSILISSVIVTVASGTVMAGEPSVIQHPLVGGQRPADIYKLTYRSDIAICDAILASLNKPVSVDLRRSSSDVAVDLVLHSNLEVPWQRKRVVYDSVSSDDLDFSFVDLANDGTSRAIFRRYFFMHNRDVTELFILPRPVESWSSGTPLNVQVIKELFDRSYPPEMQLTRQINAVLYSRDRRFVADDLDYNIVRAAGKYVILAAPSGDVAQAIDKGHAFPVFAFFYHENAPPSVVCEFLGSP